MMIHVLRHNISCEHVPIRVTHHVIVHTIYHMIYVLEYMTDHMIQYMTDHIYHMTHEHYIPTYNIALTCNSTLVD